MKKKVLQETAVFGAGCFWGVQAAFSDLRGVISTEAGYCGGKTKGPSYEEVCSGKTGHVEVVRIFFDNSVVSFDDLLEIFWAIHDPTQTNRQGPDVGSQYRSVIFFQDENQRRKATKSKKRLKRSEKFSKPIATTIEKKCTFYVAEEYHQNYLKKRDGINSFSC